MAAGPSGFTQRSKGKVAFSEMWAQGVQQFGQGSVIAYTTAGTQTISGQSAFATIASSSVISIWQMGSPPAPGAEFVMDIISVSSGVFIKASSVASFDPSTNTVIKSTYAMTITLIGLSSVKWGIKSVYPPSTIGVAPLAGITLSTTT